MCSVPRYLAGPALPGDYMTPGHRSMFAPTAHLVQEPGTPLYHLVTRALAAIVAELQLFVTAATKWYQVLEVFTPHGDLIVALMVHLPRHESEPAREDRTNGTLTSRQHS